MSIEDDCQGWAYLTDPILLHIFRHLSPHEILTAGATCRNWNLISYDELLWRNKFRKSFNISSSIEIKPGETSWFEEYKRLTYHAPLVETEVLKSHTAAVLHVTFSHNGKYFVTCSGDGFVLVWNSSCPASIKYSCDMKKISWKFTQYSEFNQSDTLLLVCGSHFGKIDDSSGEIAIFSFDDNMTMIARVINKPYDVFGTFYSDEYIFSGQVQHIGNLICASSIWIHKAYPDVTSEHKPLMSRLFRFLNVNASLVRTLLVAECKPNVLTKSSDEKSQCTPSVSNANVDKRGFNFDLNLRNKARSEGCKSTDKPPWFLFNEDYRSSESVPRRVSDAELSETESASLSETLSDNEEELDTDSDEDLSSQPEKYLIFTTGSKTYTPHQIGFKRIGQIKFPKTLDPGPSLAERIAERRERNQRPPLVIEDINIDDLSKNFDSVDHLIELHGHIIGMKLSPDHRYLYVNCRPWPEGYVITNASDPPPVAQEIDIHVIDLSTFKEVGVMLRAHRAYTPSEECFLICLDVCNDYIASGSEDQHGYLWDRHYGIGLTKFPHSDAVNDVAFNPKDPETMVTVSDDRTIKVWRSRNRTAQLFSSKNDYPWAIKLSPKRRPDGMRAKNVII